MAHAFAVAAVAAALAPTLFWFGLAALENGLSIGGVGTALIFAYGAVMWALLHIGLALPFYFLLRRRWQVTWANAAIAGFVTGALPVTLWLACSDMMLLVSMVAVATFGCAGLVGGLAFRAALGAAA